MSSDPSKIEKVRIWYVRASWVSGIAASLFAPFFAIPYQSALDFQTTGLISGIAGWAITYILFRERPHAREALIVLLAALAVYFAGNAYSASMGDFENRFPAENVQKLWLAYFAISQFGLLSLLAAASKLGAEEVIRFFSNTSN